MSHPDGHADLHTITVDRNISTVMTTSYTLVQLVEKMHEKSNKVRSIITAKSQSEDVPAV